MPRPAPDRDLLRRGLAGLALFVGLVASPLAAAPACRPAELVTGFGDWSEQDIEISAANPVQPVSPRTARGADASFLRLLIAVDVDGGRPWTLSIYDSLGHLVSLLDRGAFAGPGATVWTGRLPGPALTLTLTGGDAATRVMVRGGIAQRSEAGATAFSLRNPPTPDWRPLYPVLGADGVRIGNVPDAMRRTTGDKVGIMIASAQMPAAIVDGVTRPAEHEAWCCTGVMVGRDLFMTNWHCGGGARGRVAWDGEVRGGALIDLAWEGGPVRRQFSVTDIVFKDERLDVAILRIRPVAGSEGGVGGAEAVRIDPAPPVAGTALYMIHHALCQPKLVSGVCQVTRARRAAWTDDPGAALQPDIEHNCDSEPGASGGAIFNLDGRLVALHHLGHSQGPSCPDDRINKAVGIGAIAALVKLAKPALATELGW